MYIRESGRCVLVCSVSFIFFFFFGCCCFFVYARGMIGKSLKIVLMCVYVLVWTICNKPLHTQRHCITVARQQVKYILCSLSFIPVPHIHLQQLVFSVRLNSFFLVYNHVHTYIHVYISIEFFVFFGLFGRLWSRHLNILTSSSFVAANVYKYWEKYRRRCRFVVVFFYYLFVLFVWWLCVFCVMHDSKSLPIYVFIVRRTVPLCTLFVLHIHAYNDLPIINSNPHHSLIWKCLCSCTVWCCTISFRSYDLSLTCIVISW